MTEEYLKESRSQKNGVLKTCIALIGFFAFTSVTIISSNFFYSALFLFLLFGTAVTIRSATFDRNLNFFIIFFLTPFFVGLLGYIFSFSLESERFDYSELNFIGRFLNLFTFYLTILFIHKATKKVNPFLVFKWYQIGIFILLLTALWHAISLYTGLLGWPFETRSHLHSTYGESYSIATRVTGIAREPSFLVMYIVDFIALCFIFYSGLKRNALILFACILMLLSLSPSGYVVLMASFTLAYSVSRLKRFNTKSIVRFVLFVTAVAFIFIYLHASNNQFLDYFFSRISNVDASNSGRLYMLLAPFEWIQESNPFSILFGHGLKSYSIIGTYYSLPNGDPIHVTSNNLYIDVLWESGLIGLLTLIIYFLYIFIKICSLKVSPSKSFIVLFIFFDVLLSAFFRADYASFRFFIMLYLLYLLVNYNFYEPRKECTK